MQKKKLTAKVVGKNIQYYRKQRGLIQAELGILAFGYSPEQKNAAHTLISKFETGRQEPKATELANLISVLGINCKQLFDLTIEIIPAKSKKRDIHPSVKSADLY